VTARLEVGGVIRRVRSIYFEQASILFPAAAVVFVIQGLVSQIILADAPGLSIFALGLQLVASSVYTGMVVGLVADVRDGRRDADWRQLLQGVRPVLGELILISVVSAIGEAIGFVFLVVPGLILLTLWAVASPVVVIEHPGGLRALGRSQQLVSGNAWPVFWVMIFFIVILAVGVAVAVTAAIASTAAGIVAEVVVSVLALPLLSLASAVLYFELRDAPHPAAS
jgi:hypothetical protein